MVLLETIYQVFEFLFVVLFNYLVALKRLIVPPARKSIQGQVVLVTGAGKGIGRAIAMELAKHGAIIALWDVNKEGVEDTARMVTKAGCKAFPDTVDVTNTAEIAQAAGRIRENLGEVDVLINNAGVINCAELLDLTEKAIRRTYEVNILAHYWTVREFLPSMIERKCGHIVNMVSVVALTGARCFLDYSATKAAGRNFTEGLRRELSFQNRDFVKVTAIFPHFTDTGFLRTAAFPESQTLQPHEVGEAVVNGMLRNYNEVFIPASNQLLARLISLLPISTLDYLVDKMSPPLSAQFEKDKSSKEKDVEP